MTKQEIIQETEEEYFARMEKEQFLNQTLTTPETSLSIGEDFTIEQNNRIIKAADEVLLDRMENKDGSLRLGEVIQAKGEAFKQNQLLKNKATENINLNINELKNKNTDELLLLLDSLNE